MDQRQRGSRPNKRLEKIIGYNEELQNSLQAYKMNGPCSKHEKMRMSRERLM
jgi:hypothetical protein